MAYRVEKGQKFNRLTVSSEVFIHGRRNDRCALFRCECGTEKTLKVCSVVSGRTKSCGCANKIKHDPNKYIGYRSGKLQIVKFLRKSKTKYIYEVRCDCGIEKELAGDAVIYNRTLSCGSRECRQTAVSHIDAATQAIYTHYKCTAKDRGIDFILNIKQFKSLIFKNCYYCDVPPSNVYTRRLKFEKININYSGIDRIDSLKSYSVDNVRPCCRQCNTAKLNHDEDEFYRWIEKCYNNLQKKMNE